MSLNILSALIRLSKMTLYTGAQTGDIDCRSLRQNILPMLWFMMMLSGWLI